MTSSSYIVDKLDKKEEGDDVQWQENDDEIRGGPSSNILSEERKYEEQHTCNNI